MSKPIVIAHHLVMTAYGWWLPNDPRGGTSERVASVSLEGLGEHHVGRRKEQPPSKGIRRFYREAEDVLNHTLLEFGFADIEIVAEGFADAVAEHRYTCYACAILPDHVHLLIRKHRDSAEQMIEGLQRASRSLLVRRGRRAPEHPVWATGGWKGFLDRPEGVRRTIRYIQDNPVKMRRGRQEWGFVTEYDGWPLHPGHSPNSPYARRLRGECQ